MSAKSDLRRSSTAPGRYRTIVADPPWEYDDRNAAWVQRDAGRMLPYESMDLEAIKALPVQGFAVPDVSGTTHRRTGRPHDGTTLYLWTTTRYLEAAYDVARAWGFRPSTVLVWCKPRRGFNVGGTYASTVEFIVVAQRGTPKPARTRIDTRWFEWPRGPHSAKPEAFYDMVEQVHEGPYLELFARRDRLGWDTWGNESLGTAEMAA